MAKTAAADPTPPSPEETLRWEAANRGRAATAAFCAAALTLTGAVLTGVAFNSLPPYDDRVVTVLDALGNLAGGQPVPPGRAVGQLQYIGDHPAAFLAGPLLTAVGALFIYLALAYLFKATRARTGQGSQLPLITAAIGAVSYAVGTAVVGIMRVVEGANLAANATNSDALDAISAGPVVVGTVIQLLGSFALGFSFVLISLNAMRAGLLTRFMGVLGMIVGATFVLPLDQQGIIRSFWLGALGFLLARRWPRGVPPAWDSGKAEPWPSAAQVREERAREAGKDPGASTGGGRGGGLFGRGSAPAPAPPPPSTPAPAPPAEGQLTAGQRRKKRKKK
jgi:hypothetical protein